MGLYQGDKLLSSIGKSPAAYAKDAGYTGTDDNFYTALANMPDHLSNQENPHGTTASQVGADVAGAANEALNSAKAYTDQIVAGVIPGDGSKESPADSDSIFIYDNADSGKPKKTLISKLVELFKNTFYTKDETSTLLANNDPRQWGLGSTIAPKVTDLNTVFSNGWYRTSDGDAVNFPTTSDGQNHKYGWLFVTTGFYTRQDYYANTTDPMHFIRYYVDGNWSPWEIENPPMLLGVEYRTTERFLGLPVYVKAVDMGNLPNQTVKSISNYAENVKYVIDFDGFSYYYGQSLRNSDFARIFARGNFIAVETFGDLSSGTAIMWVKYTKTTD